MKFLRNIFGYYYLQNKKTKEIHNLKEQKGNCGLQWRANKNFKYLTKKKALKIIKNEEGDGCIHCMPRYNNG